MKPNKKNLNKLEKDLLPEWELIYRDTISRDVNNIITDEKTRKELNVNNRITEAFNVQDVFRKIHKAKKCAKPMKLIFEPIIKYINELRINAGLKTSKNWKVLKVVQKKKTTKLENIQDLVKYWNNNDYNDIDEDKFVQLAQRIDLTVFQKMKSDIADAFELQEDKPKKFKVAIDTIYANLCNA